MVSNLKQSTTVDLPTCKYCKRSFRKESTLAVHQCELKRRWAQENETGVRLGMAAYLQFYTATQGSAVSKTYANFVDSPYYAAFVKFGRYMVAIRAINTTMFIDWVIKNNKKLDKWTSESFYTEYLFEYLRKEHPIDALTRSITEMQTWEEEEGKSFETIFRSGSPNKICNMISNGRLSPWVLYNCDSGIDMLSSLNEDQIALVFAYIDPDFWQRKFKDFLADAEYIKMVLKKAGL